MRSGEYLCQQEGTLQEAHVECQLGQGQGVSGGEVGVQPGDGLRWEVEEQPAMSCVEDVRAGLDAADRCSHHGDDF